MEDKEKARARRKRWVEANPERAKEHARRGSRKYRKAHPEIIRAANARRVIDPEENRARARRARHAAFNKDPKTAWKREALAKAKVRAREKDIPFTLADIECPEICPVFGTPLIYARRGLRTAHEDSPSIDRVVPSLGYVHGNVRVISHKANRIKNDATADELRLVLAYVLDAQCVGVE